MNYRKLKRFFKEAKEKWWIYSRSPILIMRILEEHPEGLAMSDILYYAQQVREATYATTILTLKNKRLIRKKKEKYYLTRRGRNALNRVREFYRELIGI